MHGMEFFVQADPGVACPRHRGQSGKAERLAVRGAAGPACTEAPGKTGRGKCK